MGDELGPSPARNSGRLDFLPWSHNSQSARKFKHKGPAFHRGPVCAAGSAATYAVIISILSGLEGRIQALRNRTFDRSIFSPMSAHTCEQ